VGLITVGLLCLNGCVGTVFTRIHSPGDWAGGYPFQAVVFDAGAIGSDWQGGHAGIGVGIPLAATFSWPWDLAIDALLLPLDLVFWLAGWDKSTRPSAPPAAPPPQAPAAPPK
jgi:hypothetical protein